MSPSAPTTHSCELLPKMEYSRSTVPLFCGRQRPPPSAECRMAPCSPAAHTCAPSRAHNPCKRSVISNAPVCLCFEQPAREKQTTDSKKAWFTQPSNLSRPKLFNQLLLQ